MSHELEVGKDGKASMAYTKSGGVPWHGLGEAVQDDMTPAQMLKAAKLDWKVEKRELFFNTAKKGEKQIEVPDKYALVRATDEQVLSIVGSVYKPVQNDQVMDFFKKFTKAGHMKMETAGSLQNGQYIWALARVGKDIYIDPKKKDEVRPYLLISQPHVIGKAMVIQFTPIRVVCWNTLNLALGGGLKGGKSAFRMPHSIEFNDSVKKTAEAALGLAKEQTDLFADAVQLLAKKKARPEAVESYFCDVLRYDPKAAKGKDKKTEREPRMLGMLRNALEYSPGADMNTAKGTWWGALNAVTYVVDHEVGRDRGASLRTAWLGAKSNMKRRAFDLAVEKAK
jgi:phage/plasmid-like protein (TIGR03299 family)